jgi:hypothetical protein
VTKSSYLRKESVSSGKKYMGRNILRKSKCHEMVLSSRNPWYSTERDINHQITGGVSNDITVDVNDPDNVNPLIYSIRRKVT